MARIGHLRGSSLATLVLGLGTAAVLSVLLDASRLADARRQTAVRPSSAPVHSLQLTDLALFNEARYARHASQADRHAAFQDHPMALEHFPAGSLIPPPDARLD